MLINSLSCVSMLQRLLQISTEGPSQEDVGRGKAEALLTRIPLDVRLSPQSQILSSIAWQSLSGINSLSYLGMGDGLHAVSPTRLMTDAGERQGR